MHASILVVSDKSNGLPVPGEMAVSALVPGDFEVPEKVT